MSERSTTLFTNGYQPSADQINKPARKGAAEMAFALATALGLNTTDAVLDGLDVSGVAATMTVQATAGVALRYNSAPVSPLGPWELFVSQAVVASAALSNGDAVNDRIDVISCWAPTGGLDNELVAKKGAPSDVIPTRRGGAFALVVTEGTPAGSPVAPATPAGTIKLAEVAVPALTAVISGTTIADYRNLMHLERKGPGSPSAGWTQTTDTWANIQTLLQLSGVRDVSAHTLAFAADTDNDWPVFYRFGEPAGDYGSALYPLIAAARGWWETTPGDQTRGAEATTAHTSVEAEGYDGSTWVGTKVTHLNSTADAVNFVIAVATGSRAQSIQEAILDLRVDTTFVLNSTARLEVYDASADAVVHLSDSTPIVTTGAGYLPLAMANPVEWTPQPGDIVFVAITIAFPAAPDAGEINLLGVRSLWVEGRG